MARPGSERMDLADVGETHHRIGDGLPEPSGNALRAAVLGANDGLVSNLSLVMGVAGAALDQRSIIIAGLAGLLAGSGSMAMGEWISVQSARELAKRQLRDTSSAVAAHPQRACRDLRKIYRERGLSEDEAALVADRLMVDRDGAIDTLARERLGIDQGDLGGSAWEAAITSFLLFAVGAVIPLLPFFLLQGRQAVGVSVVASGLGLFGIGAAITRITGRRTWFGGLRQMAFGLAAAALTYLVGLLLGASVAG